MGGKDVVIMGAGTGGCLTQSGWEAMGAKNMVARDGYVSARRDSTTNSRSAPVPFRPPGEFPSLCYPCKVLETTLHTWTARLCLPHQWPVVVIRQQKRKRSTCVLLL